MKKKTLKSGLFLLIVLIAFTDVNAQSAKKMLKSDWTIQTYGNPAVSMNLPVNLSIFELDVPENAKDLISSMQNFMYDKSDEVIIVISTVNYKENVTLDITAAGKGFLGGLKDNPDISKLKSEVKELKIDNGVGEFHFGTYKQLGLKWDFVNEIIFINGSLYQLMLIIPYKNNKAIEVRNKIIDSIKF